MTSIAQESDDGEQLSEMEARAIHVGEVQVEMAAAERAAICQSLESRPEPHLIKALTLMANEHEREVGYERDYDYGDYQ